MFLVAEKVVNGMPLDGIGLVYCNDVLGTDGDQVNDAVVKVVVDSFVPEIDGTNDGVGVAEVKYHQINDKFVCGRLVEE